MLRGEERERGESVGLGLSNNILPCNAQKQKPKTKIEKQINKCNCLSEWEREYVCVCVSVCRQVCACVKCKVPVQK